MTVDIDHNRYMGSMHHVSLLIGMRSYLTAYVLACVTHAHTHIHVYTHLLPSEAMHASKSFLL